MEARARQENEGGRSHRRASRATTSGAERRRTIGGLRDGRLVPPHWRSNLNKEWRDNWSTNPNVNPYTGREGSRINPAQR